VSIAAVLCRCRYSGGEIDVVCGYRTPWSNQYPLVCLPGQLFAGLAEHRPECVEIWKALNPTRKDREIFGNFPIRQPLLWV
jgi:hypothetical protein